MIKSHNSFQRLDYWVQNYINNVMMVLEINLNTNFQMWFTHPSDLRIT